MYYCMFLSESLQRLPLGTLTLALAGIIAIELDRLSVTRCCLDGGLGQLWGRWLMCHLEHLPLGLWLCSWVAASCQYVPWGGSSPWLQYLVSRHPRRKPGLSPHLLALSWPNLSCSSP